MASVSGFRKLKATRSEISSDSESDYSNFFYDKSDDSDNESFSTINSESEDESDNLDDARTWIKLSSVPENISAAPPRCAVCCRKSVNGKKVRKETRLWCKDCEVGLCISPCFKIYHTLRNF